MLQMSRGQLRVRAASPKNIRPSGAFDRPTRVLVYHETRKFNPSRYLSLVIDNGFLARNEPEGALWKKLRVEGNGPSRGQEDAETAPGAVLHMPEENVGGVLIEDLIPDLRMLGQVLSDGLQGHAFTREKSSFDHVPPDTLKGPAVGSLVVN